MGGKKYFANSLHIQVEKRQRGNNDWVGKKNMEVNFNVVLR